MIFYAFAALLVAFLAASGVASCEHKTIVSLEASIEANKIEAQRILASEIAKNAVKEAADKKFSATVKENYDVQLKKLTTRPPVMQRLHDPGRDSGGCSGSAPGARTSTSTSPAVESELSRSATDFLYSEARRADEIRIWAQSCYNFVNKKDTQ